MVKTSFLQDFLLIFSATFGIVMGMGFIFIGYTNNNFYLLVVGFVIAITGLFSAVFLKNE